eukprot:TRINITY_DN11506_c0_g2_i2.p1 TRINITY_DN11506_c0_g2~~TRINITY_DN11506_c0_g2_i2.p1  ORF type:complete len:387 (+),score=109.94 TRINITY_DN11506_c0_g2_i2:168-1328(+)
MALKVTILIVGGKVKFSLELSKGAETTVAELKEQIAASHEDSPVEAQMLICAGKKLADEQALKEYDIKDGATIYVGKKPGAASPSKETKAEYKSKDELVKGVMAGLGRVKEQATPEEFQLAMKTIATLIGNLCAHPEDPKFKRIRHENPALKQRLFRFEGAADALKSIGFEDSTEEPGSMFVRKMNPNLPDVHKMLRQALGLPAATPVAASSSASASASASDTPGGFPFGGMGAGGAPSMQGLAGMMQDPAIANIMSNPEMMQSIMPQVQQLMQNPEALQSMMSAFGGASGGSPFANNPNLSAQMAAAAQQLQSNPQMMQNLASAMSSGNPSDVTRSMEAQEDAMLQEAIRLSMMDSSQDGNAGDGSQQQQDQSNSDSAGDNAGVD